METDAVKAQVHIHIVMTTANQRAGTTRLSTLTSLSFYGDACSQCLKDRGRLSSSADLREFEINSEFPWTCKEDCNNTL